MLTQSSSRVVRSSATDNAGLQGFALTVSGGVDASAPRPATPSAGVTRASWSRSSGGARSAWSGVFVMPAIPGRLTAIFSVAPVLSRLPSQRRELRPSRPSRSSASAPARAPARARDRDRRARGDALDRERREAGVALLGVHEVQRARSRSAAAARPAHAGAGLDSALWATGSGASVAVGSEVASAVGAGAAGRHRCRRGRRGDGPVRRRARIPAADAATGDGEVVATQRRARGRLRQTQRTSRLPSSVHDASCGRTT